MESLTTHITSNRQALKEELAGNIVFDDHSVFRRLGIEELSVGLVSACVTAMESDPAVQNARQHLEEDVADAENMTTMELREEEEEEDREEDDGRWGASLSQKVRRPTWREQSMCEPMVSVIIKISASY